MINNKLLEKKGYILGLILSMLLLCTLVMFPRQMAGAEEVKPPYGGTYVIGLAGDPPTLTGGFTTATPTQYVTPHVYSGLVFYDYNLQPIPDLAESWEIAPDGMNYTFHLVHNATFHDGVPVTSADVKFSWDEAFQKYMVYAGTVGIYVDKVETPDNHTVIFKMKQAFAPFLTYLPAWFFPILPMHLFNGTDVRNNAYSNAPVGSGPFKFAEYTRGDHITFTRNANYFRTDQWGRTLPYLDKVVFRIIPDSTLMAIAFERGEIDAICHEAVARQLVNTMLQAPNATVFWTPSAWFASRDIIFNMNNTIVGNKLVRQAIAYAINRTELLEKCVYGQGSVNATIGVSSTLGFYYNPNQLQYPYNVTKANELLDQAGYPGSPDVHRFNIRFVHPGPYDPAVGTAAQIIKQRLHDNVGIECVDVPSDYAAWISTTFVNWDFDMTIAMPGKGPDPGVSTARFFVSWNQKHVAYSNIGYNNSQVDALFTDFNKEVDPAKRQAIMFNATAILAEDLPMYILWEQRYPFLYKNTFVNAWSTPWLNERQDETWSTLAQVGPEAEQPIPWVTYVAIAVAAIVIVSVAAVFVMKRRKKP